MARREAKRYRKKEEKAPEPIPFVLEFERLDGTVEEFEMEALGEPPLGYVNRMVKMVERDGTGRRFIDTSAGRFDTVMGVLRVVLTPASRDTLAMLEQDPDGKVDFGQLVDVFNDLTTEYANRPTTRSAGSSDGPQTTELGSTGNESTPTSVPSSESSSPDD